MRPGVRFAGRKSYAGLRETPWAAGWGGPSCTPPVSPSPSSVWRRVDCGMSPWPGGCWYHPRVEQEGSRTTPAPPSALGHLSFCCPLGNWEILGELGDPFPAAGLVTRHPYGRGTRRPVTRTAEGQDDLLGKAFNDSTARLCRASPRCHGDQCPCPARRRWWWSPEELLRSRTPLPPPSVPSVGRALDVIVVTALGGVGVLLVSPGGAGWSRATCTERARQGAGGGGTHPAMSHTPHPPHVTSLLPHQRGVLTGVWGRVLPLHVLVPGPRGGAGAVGRVGVCWRHGYRGVGEHWGGRTGCCWQKQGLLPAPPLPARIPWGLPLPFPPGIVPVTGVSPPLLLSPGMSLPLLPSLGSPYSFLLSLGGLSIPAPVPRAVPISV